MKKVLFITSTLRKGGLTNVIYGLAKYLDKSLYDVNILTLSKEPPNTDLAEFEKISDLKIHSLNLSRLQGLLFSKKKAQKFIENLKPDVIHSHGIRADGVLSKIKTNARRIATIHGFIDEDYTMTYGKTKGMLMCKSDVSYLKKMCVCVGCSQSVANYVRQKFDLQNVIGIPNGIDTTKYFAVSEEKRLELRKKLSIPQNAIIWLSTGKFTSRKQPLFMVKQWLLYTEVLKEQHLYILGAGEQYDECVELAKGHNNIHLPGRVDNVNEYLQAGDYYVSASKSEGFSMAVLEAVACGMPLLLTDIPQYKEVLVHNEYIGRNYKLDDSEDFISRLQELLNIDKETARKNAIETAKSEFSAKKMTERYVEVYFGKVKFGL